MPRLVVDGERPTNPSWPVMTNMWYRDRSDFEPCSYVKVRYESNKPPPFDTPESTSSNLESGLRRDRARATNVPRRNPRQIPGQSPPRPSRLKEMMTAPRIPKLKPKSIRPFKSVATFWKCSRSPLLRSHATVTLVDRDRLQLYHANRSVILVSSAINLSEDDGLNKFIALIIAFYCLSFEQNGVLDSLVKGNVELMRKLRHFGGQQVVQKGTD
jgi:hypothetical protein